MLAPFDPVGCYSAPLSNDLSQPQNQPHRVPRPTRRIDMICWLKRVTMRLDYFGK